MTLKDKIIGITLFSVLTLGVFFLIFLSNKNQDKNRFRDVVIQGEKLLSKNSYLSYCFPMKEYIDDETTLSQLREQILSHPYIKNVDIELTTDKKAVAYLKEKIVKALILVEGKPFLITENFEVLNILEKTNILDFPTINNSKLTGVTGQQVISEPGVTEAFKIIDIVNLLSKELYNNFSEINLRHGKEIILSFSDDYSQVVLGKGDFPRKLNILKNLKYDTKYSDLVKSCNYIDLRYDNYVYLGMNEKIGI
jgi:cell division septal protein FtsQ